MHSLVVLEVRPMALHGSRWSLYNTFRACTFSNSGTGARIGLGYSWALTEADTALTLAISTRSLALFYSLHTIYQDV